MKRSIRVLTAALAGVVLAIGMTACSRLHKVEFDKTSGGYVDGRTGITYFDAPGCYEPVAIGEEYAKLTYDGQGGVVLHEVGGLDPAKWLCEEGKTVFYAEGETLPTLGEMAPEKVYLCIEDVNTLVLSTVTEAADIAALIDVWENGREVPYSGAEPTINLRVKFESSAYPSLYYSLIYLEYSDGQKVLYDRYAARCVEVGDVLLTYVG